MWQRMHSMHVKGLFLPGSLSTGAAVAGAMHSVSTAEISYTDDHAPCCQVDKPVPHWKIGRQSTQAAWSWQQPVGEKPNHLALHVPRNPDMFAKVEVGSLETKLVSPNRDGKGGSVDYSVILPPDHAKDRAEPYPLFISLHPAGRGADHLIDPAGAARTGRDVIAPRDVVWASFSAGPGSGYNNWQDGSEQGRQEWERFFIEEFIPYVEKNFNCGGHQSRRYLTGICMGGRGVLQYAFKHPSYFAAAAAQQAAIPAAIDHKDVTNKQDLKLDPKFYREHRSHIAMAIDNADEIRSSGLRLYLDVGDDDYLVDLNAIELLHRYLWYLRIPHDYHLVLDANHVGSSWRRRGPEAMDFLYRCMEHALNPQLEETIMTKEEKQWSDWKLGQDPNAKPEFKSHGAEPPKPKCNFTDAGVFSDKNEQWLKRGWMVRGQKRASGAPINDKTDGPAELPGHLWRMPRAE